YEMATGRRPFDGKTSIATLTSILRDTPPPVTAMRDELPEGLAALIARCLEKDPTRRFPHAAELRDALRAVATGIEGTSPAERARRRGAGAARGGGGRGRVARGRAGGGGAGGRWAARRPRARPGAPPRPPRRKGTRPGRGDGLRESLGSRRHREVGSGADGPRDDRPRRIAGSGS